jgi:hypothetical protein
MTSRPPLPPFTQETAVQKVRLAEDGWNTRNPGEGLSCLHSILVGETVPSSSTGESRSWHSCRRNGRENLITGSLRSCGRFMKIASRYVLRTNTTMTRELVPRLRK